MLWEQRLKELVALEQKLTELGILLRRGVFPLETEEQKALSRLSGTEMDTQTKISVFQKYGEKVDQQDTLYEQNKIHLQDQIRAKREKEMAEITEKIRKLEANCLVFPPEIERARKLDPPGTEKSGHRYGGLYFCRAGTGSGGSGMAEGGGDLPWQKALLSDCGWRILRQGHAVLKEKKLYSANVVLTDKLPDEK